MFNENQLDAIQQWAATGAGWMGEHTLPAFTRHGPQAQPQMIDIARVVEHLVGQVRRAESVNLLHEKHLVALQDRLKVWEEREEDAAQARFDAAANAAVAGLSAADATAETIAKEAYDIAEALMNLRAKRIAAKPAPDTKK